MPPALTQSHVAPPSSSTLSHRFSVAPMIDWTDRYCRFFHRQLTGRALLYTEMIVADAVLNGDARHLLDFDAAEHPVALQLGGSDPDKLAEASRIAEGFGYDEINLNVGCPSDRVQSGRFGACLMQEPDLVARCVSAMQAATSLPVTVKCRIGVDHQIPKDVLPAFIDQVAATGVTTFIVHARMAWLDGLSPKENRTIPPLDYDLVAQVRADRPHLTIILNGGIADLDEAVAQLDRFDGVMLGRAAYERPFILSSVDGLLFEEGTAPRSRLDAVRAVAEHADRNDTPIWRYVRHMLGLYHGQKGARAWRRRISEEGRSDHATPAWLIEQAEDMEAVMAEAAS
ncbi:tRNA dihydrouridine(20/20a) synthase DusA [Parvularcula sp. LCG005]|uniref:tRNA dihydrouridine(20/20a) synthase DusA n=1 Tax=Parvularcula sp. LCG005 TaxID=3078805 RepID=UPI0029421359|nr:tRNA dihydrouridine(20/20a) synthase DusA [Parvularcula sp. LCG005]WOI54102.1 tRNA dihydrouridine(20/20a) synthase DusA [Parvularcula sp. LCG005]